jgi:hypothetical protein
VKDLHITVGSAKYHDDSPIPDMNLAVSSGLLRLSPFEMMKNAKYDLVQHEKDGDEAKDLMQRVKSMRLETKESQH